MAADALAPCVARSSAAVILTACAIWIGVFLSGEFQKPAVLQYSGLMWNTNVILGFVWKIQHDKE